MLDDLDSSVGNSGQHGFFHMSDSPATPFTSAPTQQLSPSPVVPTPTLPSNDTTSPDQSLIDAPHASPPEAPSEDMLEAQVNLFSG